MSEIKVNSIKGVGASAAAITVNNTDGTCTANITNNLSNRNLIINGAMQVAQRGTSSPSDGYQTVDRFQQADGNIGVTVTQSQQSLSSSDTGPYEAGFRKYYRAALASAGTANANAEVHLYSHLEAQNIANSGWNYTSASSYITLSFWFRCSTNQTFYFYLRSRDGSQQNYPFSFTASANNTWTKVTKTIAGNSNLQFDDDNGSGLSLNWIPFNGTDKTNNKALNQWDAYSGSNVLPDMASTWLTAGASTFDVTGVQLEVGSVATDFEHRSFKDEMASCQRYFYMHAYGSLVNTALAYSTCMGTASRYTDSAFFGPIFFPVKMRTIPSFVKSLGTDRLLFFGNGGSQGFNDIATQSMGVNSCIVNYYDSLNSSLQAGWVQLNNNSAYVGFSAEL